MGEELGFFHGLVVLGFALGLEFVQELHVALEVAVDALLVEGQEIEGRGLGQEGFGVGEGDPGFAAFMAVTQGEHVVLDCASPVETPTVLRDGVGELAFHGRFGGETVDEFVAEGVVGFAVLGWQEADVAGQAVT